MITEDEWLLIHDLKEILTYFAEAIDYLGGSKYCTYSSINPTITLIMMKICPLTNSTINFNLDEIGDAFDEILELERDETNINTPIETQGLFDQIKKNLYKALIHYFNPTSSEALLAALFDPRFKKLKFAMQEQKKDAENELYRKYDTIKLNQSNSTSLLLALSQQWKKWSLFDAFTSSTVAKNEVVEYLALEEILFEKDPYAWWNERKEKFLIINQLVRKILDIQVVSIPFREIILRCG